MIEGNPMAAPARASLCLVGVLALGAGPAAAAPLTVGGTAATAQGLALSLAGCGVQVTDARTTGAKAQFGFFTTSITGIVGFNAGLIISTGLAASVPNRNLSENDGTGVGGAGDPDLTALSGVQTFDAAVLEFDFVPSGTVLTFDYTFASDEYNEYVGSAYNDVFAFWLDGVNVALVPGSGVPVTINNVNLGANATYYRNNDLASGAPEAIMFDGLTTVLSVSVPIMADVRHTIRFAIADSGDAIYDSAVFIRSGSFTTNCLPSSPVTSSTSLAASGAATALRAVPNPFRPGRGGAQDAAQVTLVDVPAGGTIHIYTTAGARVATLADADGDGLVTWDGQAANGSPAASGVYLVVAEGPTGARRRTRLVIAR
jgi:hypothetical protein